ncbi:MAG: hypothetical protein AAGD43_35075 [Pseudomonadota bacterium]
MHNLPHHDREHKMPEFESAINSLPYEDLMKIIDQKSGGKSISELIGELSGRGIEPPKALRVVHALLDAGSVYLDEKMKLHVRRVGAAA